MNEELKKNISKKGKITGNTNSHFFNIGEVVTIVGVSDVSKNIYHCKGLDGSRWSIYTHEIEIIEDIPIKNEDKTGKKYRCIENNVHFTTSDIITLIKDDGSCCCLYQSNNGTKAYFMNDKLVPMSEDTPDDKDRTGKKYRCIEADCGFVVGDIVTMVEDDESDCCLYEKEDGGKDYIMNYKFVPVSEDTPDTKLEINKEQTFNGDSHSTVTTVKKNKLMDKLKKIPNTLKRIIDKDLQAMYKVSFINGDLAITEKGANELMNYLITIPETKKALSDIAKEIIKEIKDNN